MIKQQMLVGTLAMLFGSDHLSLCGDYVSKKGENLE
jgi:hypothetical protein